MGITSAGHRLAILKSVYDVKKAQDVPIEPDHYHPPSMFSPSLDMVMIIVVGPIAHSMPFCSCRGGNSVEYRDNQGHKTAR